MSDQHCRLSPLSLLRQQSWLSPAFPTGSYSYSHAIEWAIEAGDIHDRKSLVDWLEADLCYGSGRNEAIFFMEAWRCATEDDCEALCKRLRDTYDIYVITKDIYTKEDQLILTRAQALPAERILGVETGGCPHTAIREDASMNLAAIEEMNKKFPHAELCFVESGGDNLAATFSPELADLTIYVIDVAEGEKIPRKGGPGITRSDLLIINKIDLAPLVGADLGVMEADTLRVRGKRPFVFSNLKSGQGVEPIANFIMEKGGLVKGAA